MTIQEILEAHTQSFDWYPCKCGWKPTWDGRGAGEDQHRAHVVEVLEQHMQEREAEVKAAGYTEAADALHSEARWQYERHTRHMPGAQIVAQRMSLMEEIMRDRAKELTNGR